MISNVPSQPESGPAEEGKKPSLCYKSTACEILRISRKSFDKLRIKPTKTVRNPHYYSAAEAVLYNRAKIERMAQTKRVAALRTKPRMPYDYSTKFRNHFSVYTNAIPKAAEALFHLNRYAKHTTCSDANRREIMGLKNDFIELLYKQGYCTSAGIHVQKKVLGLQWNRKARHADPIVLSIR